MDSRGIQTIPYADLDRAIFEPLRRAVVVAGYLPDVTLYATAALYKTARETLRATLVAQDKALIEIFGVGGFNSRDGATDSRIVIDRHVENKGTIGGWGTTYLEQVSGSGQNAIFDKKRNPSSSTDITYAIRTICKDAEMDRIMGTVIKNELTQLGFLYAVNPDGTYAADKPITVSYVGMVDVSVKEYMERIYKITMQDVFVEPEKLVQQGIPVMTTVHFGIYLLPETAGEEPVVEMQYGTAQEVVIPTDDCGYKVVEDEW